MLKFRHTRDDITSHGKTKMTAIELKNEIAEIKEEIANVKEIETGDYFPAWEKERDLERLYARLGKLIAEL